MNIKDAIEFLDKYASDPKQGLPDELFYYISRMTPLVNVDLLIKDENSRTLLSWRDDKYAGKGWHVMGGIVRFKETLETRIKKVAENEIGVEIQFDPVPIAVNELISDHDERGHFISILFKCFLSGKFVPENNGLTEKDRGYLKWHDVCPPNLIKCHEVYRKYINESKEY